MFILKHARSHSHSHTHTHLIAHSKHVHGLSRRFSGWGRYRLIYEWYYIFRIWFTNTRLFAEMMSMCMCGSSYFERCCGVRFLLSIRIRSFRYGCFAIHMHPNSDRILLVINMIGISQSILYSCSQNVFSIRTIESDADTPFSSVDSPFGYQKRTC